MFGLTGIGGYQLYDGWDPKPPEFVWQWYEDVGVQPGEAFDAAQICLEEDGEAIPVATLCTDKPVILMVASVTCPISRGALPKFEALLARYDGAVEGVVVYVIEAHPAGSPSPYANREWITKKNRDADLIRPQPKTLAERRQLAADYCKATGWNGRVVLDNMDNRLWEYLGGGSNSAVVLVPDGRVMARTGWYDSERLEAAIDCMSLTGQGQ